MESFLVSTHGIYYIVLALRKNMQDSECLKNLHNEIASMIVIPKFMRHFLSSIALWLLPLFVWAQPVIDTSTPRVFVDPRTPTTFAVVASGTDLTYQWYQGNPGYAAQPIAEATSDTYSPPTTNRTLESFWVWVTSAGDSANSQAYNIARTGNCVALGRDVDSNGQNFDARHNFLCLSLSTNGASLKTARLFQRKY